MEEYEAQKKAEIREKAQERADRIAASIAADREAKDAEKTPVDTAAAIAAAAVAAATAPAVVGKHEVLPSAPARVAASSPAASERDSTPPAAAAAPADSANPAPADAASETAETAIRPEAASSGARLRWIVKAYRDLTGQALLDAPVNALWGVSEGDAALLKDAFGIKTIRDLATNKYFAWAAEITEEADRG